MSLRVHVSWEEFEALAKLTKLYNGKPSGRIEWDEHPEVLGDFLSLEEIGLVTGYVAETGQLPELVPHHHPPARRLEL